MAEDDDELGSQEIPIRIACRNITGRNVSDFLKDEIPFLRHYASNISSLKIFLERFPILWIIDYDERTVEFTEFFESLLTIISSNHKIIVTSRQNSMKELKEKLKEKEVLEVSIECFDDQQLRKVAKDVLGEDKVADFESAIERLNDETLEFLKIPINLILCLELWSSDPTIFHGEIKSIYQLHDKILEKHLNLLVSRLKGMTNITIEGDLKVNVKKWFKYLCEVVAESAFTDDLLISEAQKAKLMKKAEFYGLIGTYCLSTFFNCEESSVETNYFLRHKTQKEVLSCVYLKECDDDALKAVAQQPGNHHLLNNNCFKHLTFLMECCNKCEFARIFIALQIHLGVRLDCLLQIKDENCFDDLKTQFKATGQSLMLHVNNDDQVDDLLKVLRYLMPDLNSFKIKIDKDITMHEKINDFISKYKDRNSFNLKLEFYYAHEFVPVIQMFTKKGNQNLIKELDLNHDDMKDWTEQMKKELFKLESLNFVSFYVDCWNYSSSILPHFLTEEVASKEQSEKLDSIVTPPSPLSPDVHPPQTDSKEERKKRKKKTLFSCSKYRDTRASPPSPLSRDVHPPQTASTTTNPVPLPTTSSTSLAAFDHSSHLHFNIVEIVDSSKVIGDLLEVNSKFPSMSADLKFYSSIFSYFPRIDDLRDNLLRRFVSSFVQVKYLLITIDHLSKCPNVMKLVNSGHIETLKLESQNNYESSSVSEFESFFAICDFDKMNKIKQIQFDIYAKSPLKLIYNKLPSDLLNKTELIVRLYKSSAKMKIVVESKQFKRIEIKNSFYLSASEIVKLKSISKSFIKD